MVYQRVVISWVVSFESSRNQPHIFVLEGVGDTVKTAILMELELCPKGFPRFEPSKAQRKRLEESLLLGTQTQHQI